MCVKGQEWDKQRMCVLCVKLETQTHQILNKLTTSNFCEQLEKHQHHYVPTLTRYAYTLHLSQWVNTHIGDKASCKWATWEVRKSDPSPSWVTLPRSVQRNHRRVCAVVSEPVCLLSDRCHTHIGAKHQYTPLFQVYTHRTHMFWLLTAMSGVK